MNLQNLLDRFELVAGGRCDQVIGDAAFAHHHDTGAAQITELQIGDFCGQLVIAGLGQLL